MATFGYSTTPSYGFISSGTDNTAAYVAGAMPSPGGIVTSVSVYAGLYTGSATAYLGLWDYSGNLLTYGTASLTTTPGWHTATISNYFVAAGTNLLIGFQTPGSDGVYVEYAAVTGASWYIANAASVPGNFSGTTNGGEAMGAYITYTPAGAYVNTGTPASPTWTSGSIEVNTGTPATPTWTATEADINTGTPASPTWTPGA